MLDFHWNHKSFKIGAENRFSRLKDQREADRILKLCGYRKYGNSVFSWGKIDMLKKLTERLTEAGLPYYISPTAQYVLRELRACILEQKREFKARLKRMALEGNVLHTFQRKDALRMAIADSIINAYPPGLGKTVTTLAAIPDRGRILVVCPAVMRETWREETLKWRPEISVSMLDKQDNFYFPDAPNSMLICNYEQLPLCSIEGSKTKKKMRSLDDRLSVVDDEFCTVVFDEFHYCRNLSAGRTKRARLIAQFIARANGRAMGLTGTPLERDPNDMWTLLSNLGLEKDAFGNKENFVRLNGGYTAPGRFGWETHWSGAVDDSVADLLAPYVISRSKESVWKDMPEKVFTTAYVDIKDNKVRKFLDKFMEDIGGESAIDRMDFLLTSKPKEISLYAETRAQLAMLKYAAMLEEIQEYELSREPIVVMSAHRAPVEMLGARPGWACIHGNLSEKKRDEARKAFQAGKLKGIACTIQAAGVGLTLTRSSRMFFIDQCWNPSQNEQAQDRIHRLTQLNHNCFYHIYTINHPMEKILDRNLRTKQRFIDGTVVKTRSSLIQEMDRLDHI